MEENKQETIVKLYSLRAGLSLLSSIYDRASKQKFIIQKNECEIKKQQEKQSTARKNIAHNYSITVGSLQDELTMLEKSIPQYDKELAMYSEELEKQSLKLKKVFFRAKMWKAIFITSLILIFLGTIINSIGNFINSNTDFLKLSVPNIIIIFSEVIPTAFFVIAIISGIKYFFGYRPISDMEYNPYEIALSDPKKNLGKTDPRDIIKEKNKTLEKARRDHEIYRNNCMIEIARLQREIDNMRKEVKNANEKLLPIINNFKVTYKAVQEQFAEFVDERDWGNIDLIIFNYETGRALDLRDALMQVDNERRNQRLIKAVQDASSSICYSISRGFGTLQNALEHHMIILENRISKLSSQISESAELQLEAIEESGKAQQALLDKINTSSDRMASDVQYMCQLTGYSYYNR